MSPIWPPFTQVHTAMDPIHIERGKGAYLYAKDGRVFIDGIASWWVNLHGHAHPYIAKAIAKQAKELEHVIFADFTHTPALDFAKRLLPLLPGPMSKIFFSDNGSTAVEIALKIALQFWYNQNIEKTKILCFEGSYHGDTFGAMSAAGKNLFNRPFWNHLFDVVSIPPPIKNQEEEALHHMRAALSGGKAACFLFEPLILGVGGMRMYPAKHLDPLLALCQEAGVLTIADEVMTGFGRTETLFASEQLTIQPDILCLSKGITGGFLPMGATTCKEFIYNAFLSEDPHKAFLHGHSYTANPLACASALASLDLLRDKKCYEQRKGIERAHARFCKKWQGHPALRRCESHGTILALEYETQHPSYFSSLRDSLYPYFLDRGILLRPLGNVVYLLPPYCIPEEALTHIYTTLEGTL
jgi:adenosylmethionine---8-amino-7-oxononanoate aminotransferase